MTTLNDEYIEDIQPEVQVEDIEHKVELDIHDPQNPENKNLPNIIPGFLLPESNPYVQRNMRNRIYYQSTVVVVGKVADLSAFVKKASEGWGSQQDANNLGTAFDMDNLLPIKTTHSIESIREMRRKYWGMAHTVISGKLTELSNNLTVESDPEESAFAIYQLETEGIPLIGMKHISLKWKSLLFTIEFQSDNYMKLQDSYLPQLVGLKDDNVRGFLIFQDGLQDHFKGKMAGLDVSHQSYIHFPEDFKETVNKIAFIDSHRDSKEAYNKLKNEDKAEYHRLVNEANDEIIANNSIWPEEFRVAFAKADDRPTSTRFEESYKQYKAGEITNLNLKYQEEVSPESVAELEANVETQKKLRGSQINKAIAGFYK